MLKIGNKVLKINDRWLNGSDQYDPLNPLGLPPYTIRLKYIDGHTPTFSKGTGVQVSSSPNVWDLTYENSDWSGLLSGQQYIVEVLGANTSNVTSMVSMFNSCTGLTRVPLFNTSNVTNMDSMFYNCNSLTTVPLFNTSNVTNMDWMFARGSRLTTVPLFNTSNVTIMGSMFRDCYSVESGALALYQQASSQANPPTNHSYTFSNCGSRTTTGADELAQIPSDWK